MKDGREKKKGAGPLLLNLFRLMRDQRVPRPSLIRIYYFLLSDMLDVQLQ